MGNDIMPLFHKHLEGFGKSKPRIDVLLHTHGGHTLTPNRLTYLVREYTNHFAVLVPFRAHSAGTTLALGANEIVMGPLGELGPTDPSVSNAFNPKNEESKPIQISVEDVSAYLSLAREQAGLSTPEAMAKALAILADQVHPLALGNVHRQHQLIRTMSRRLLMLHMDENEDEEKIERIVDLLTEKLFFHEYQISRAEARDMIGLPVTYPEEELEELLQRTFEAYDEDLGGIDRRLEIRREGPFLIDSAIIESTSRTDVYTFRGAASAGQNGELNLQLQRQGWEELPAQGGV